MLNCWAHSTARAKPPAEAAVDPARAASDIPCPPLFPALRVLRSQSFAVYYTALALHLALRGAAVDSRVHLLTQKHRNRRKVKVDKQRDGCTEAPVDRAVVGEVRQVERKPHRSQGPHDHGENSAGHNESNRTIPIWGETVNEKYYEHEQKERNGDAKPRPQSDKRLAQLYPPREPLRQLRPDQQQPGSNDRHTCKDGRTQHRERQPPP